MAKGDGHGGKHLIRYNLDAVISVGYRPNTPPRPLDNIEADLKKVEFEIADMLAEVTE